MLAGSLILFALYRFRNAAENREQKITSKKTSAGPANPSENGPSHISSPAIGRLQQKLPRDTQNERTRAMKRWGVFFQSSRGAVLHNLTGAAIAAIRDKGYTTAPQACAPPKMDFGSLEAAFLRGLQPVCDGLITGRADLKFETETDPSLQELITAIATIDVRIFSTRSASMSSDFGISERGGGFSQATAGTQASDRLAVNLRARSVRELP